MPQLALRHPGQHHGMNSHKNEPQKNMITEPGSDSGVVERIGAIYQPHPNGQAEKDAGRYRSPLGGITKLYRRRMPPVGFLLLARISPGIIHRQA